MKKKKILSIISSLTLAATFGLSALAGCQQESGHTHAYIEISSEPATCSAAGKRTLRCACGDITEEVIPIDPAAHDYGDWNITTYPDEANPGTATSECNLNKAHKTTVTLPVITDEGTGYYSSEITKAPTSISEGIRHFVYTEGNVSVEFDIALPKRNIENMEDAIIYGTSLGGLVRSSSGRAVTGALGDPDDSGASDTSATVITFSNYYGDNYVRVESSDNQEKYWYSVDSNGAPFGIYARTEHVLTNPLDETNGILQNPLGPDDVDEEGNPKDPNYRPIYEPKDPNYKPIYEDVPVDPLFAEGTTADHLKGYGYASGGGMRRTFGAEDTLLAYYQAAVGVGSVKYTYEFNNVTGGGYTGSFSFSRMETSYFCRYFVDFEMYDNYVIKSLRVKTKIIRLWMLANTYDGTNSGEVIRTADGDVIFSEIYPLVDGVEQYEMVTGEDGKQHVATDGVKKAPDGTVLTLGGNEIARPVPKGWTQGDWNFYYEEGDPIYAVRANGEVYDTGNTYDRDHEFIAIRTVEYFEPVLKTDNDVVEENPYPAEDLYVRSFDVKYGGNVIGDEAIDVDANTWLSFEIANVMPNGEVNLAYDPLSVYLKRNTGDVELTYDINNPNLGQNAFHIAGYFSRDTHQVRITAQHVGEVEIIIKSRSGSFSKTIKLNFLRSAPTDLVGEVYTYSDAGGTVKYTWTEFDESNDANYLTMYVGQKLYVRAAALPDEKDYADISYESSISSSNSEYVALKDGQSAPAGGGTATEITALKARDSNIVIYIDSTRNSRAYARIRIRIIDAPSVDEMLSGEYTGRFNYIKMVKTDRNPTSGDVSLTFTPASAADKTHGTVNVTVKKDNQIESGIVYNYTYDETTYKLTCEWASGRGNPDDDDVTFHFEISLNEVFKVSITHPTGFPNSEETIVLSRPQS